MPDHVYAAIAELPLRKKQSGKAAHTTVLLGAYLKVIQEDSDWYLARAFGHEGWVKRQDCEEDLTALKIFFVDVGQGDGVLIETPTERILVDGGQHANMANYLVGWKYRWLIQNQQQVHLDVIVISHFDADHFAGLTRILNDQNFTVGTIYHNGIARFHTTAASRPAGMDTDLGRTSKINGKRAVLNTTFSNLADAQALLDGGGLMESFEEFLTAAITAHQGGRLGNMEALTARVNPLPGFRHLRCEVLGPVRRLGPTGQFDWFKDSSHTRNGHSVVLGLTWGARTFLLGGDLNDLAEHHLLDHYQNRLDKLRADVAKACHHGASEFTEDFLKAVCPALTVVSSGDNQNYGHPQPDAMGSIGKYSAGQRPLLFSTELARAPSPEDVHYGLINVRSNGDLVVGAQMFENRRGSDMWNSHELAAWNDLDRCACDGV